MKIYLASDHAGYKLKKKVKKLLGRKGLSTQDLGPNSPKAVDYPDYAFAVARRVATSRKARGILICGTGTGMVIAANKVKGIRAVAPLDVYSARMSRRDNDANILGLRGRRFSYEKIKKIISVWLNTPFSGQARHKRRIKKIAVYERESR